MAEIDAATAWENGTLRTVVRGTVTQLAQAGRRDQVVADVARPVLALAETMRGNDQAGDVDALLAHAVHDGVRPSELLAAAVANERAGPATPGPVGPGGGQAP